jgi:hypothetical protein
MGNKYNVSNLSCMMDRYDKLFFKVSMYIETCEMRTALLRFQTDLLIAIIYILK